jgi:hypothetical protein
VTVGLSLTVAPPIVLCERGLHGSERLIDALGYASSSILTRCSYSGEIVRGDDKLAASERTVVWVGNIGQILHEAACHFAEVALRGVKNPDPRSIAAIAAKRAFMQGEITAEELSAARSAARSAAWSAAARSAAAWSAAWSAAESAAWSAESAARLAARSAESAAWSAQNNWLECAVRHFAGVD